MFSFNNPHGACPDCAGLGTRMYFDPEQVVPNPELSLREGAIVPWETRTGFYYQQHARRHYPTITDSTFAPPLPSLPERIREAAAARLGEGEDPFLLRSGGASAFLRQEPSRGWSRIWSGAYRETDSETVRENLERFMNVMPCPTCNGARLRQESLFVRIGGKNIREVTAFSIVEAEDFFTDLQLPPRRRRSPAGCSRKSASASPSSAMSALTTSPSTAPPAPSPAAKGSASVSPPRSVPPWSASSTFSTSRPSVCTSATTPACSTTLKRLRDLGNTVLVVEHDEETILEADHVIDMGPGAGVHGGEVVAEGTPQEILADPASLTGAIFPAT